MPLGCSEDIFGFIENSSHARQKFLVRVSFLQIYNETISDLLDPDSLVCPRTASLTKLLALCLLHTAHIMKMDILRCRHCLHACTGFGRPLPNGYCSPSAEPVLLALWQKKDSNRHHMKVRDDGAGGTYVDGLRLESGNWQLAVHTFVN